MARRVLVTGGNAGIGLALCKQLAADHGCHVLVGARSVEKADKAVAEIKGAAPQAIVEPVVMDVASDQSVAEAAAKVKASLGPDATLYAIVNNAGIGFKTGAEPQEILNVNFYGPKRVTEAFLPLLQAEGGRIVCTGSGAGPGFVKNCPSDIKKILCSFDSTWEDLQHVAKVGLEYSTYGGYGLSKALLTTYVMQLSKQYPKLVVSSLSPGFINTKMTAGFGASKTPEEGTVSLRKCILEDLPGSGWFWGSDGLRSPPYEMRNPPAPEWDGVLPPDCA